MEGSRISTLGTALSDPTRAAAIAALLSGTAHTSGELARACGVVPSTMSQHLNKLVDAGIVHVEAAGRYRHYRIASLEIADLLEQIDSLELPETRSPSRPTPGTGISYARSCYDHIAGQLGVELFDAFTTRNWVAVDGHQPSLTGAGAAVLTRLGLPVDELRQLRRPILRLDLDWTERRHHLAGSIPAALMSYMIEHRWLTRRHDKRQLSVTTTGRQQIGQRFGISF